MGECIKAVVTIFLIFVSGLFQLTLGWEYNKAPSVLVGDRTLIIDEHKPLPSLQEIRKKIKEKGYNFTVGETWVYRLSPEEMNKVLGIIPFDSDETCLKKVATTYDLPSSFDWRDTNKVTFVKKQGACGTCWAHAAIGDLESKILIAEDDYYDFSEQNLASCDFYTSSLIFTSCSGGNPFRSTNYLSQVGASLESCAPYRGTGWAPCKKTCRIIKSIDGWRVIANDVDTIKAALYGKGPISTTMDASDPAFRAYMGGVYEYYDSPVNNHAVLIVGWNDSLGPEGAWIVKNSWGSDWGMDGYFYIAYSAAGIGVLPNYISSYKDYDVNEILMYYDEGGIVSDISLGAGSPTAWCAVIFTPNITGTLRAVDFWTVSDDTSYEIRIYDEMIYDTMENLLSIQEGTCKEMGYYSIPLFSPVSVTKDDDFIIVTKLTTPGNNYPIPADMNFNSPVESGRCYLSEDGESWILIGVNTEIPYDVALRARVVRDDPPTWDTLYGTMLGGDEEKSLALLRKFRDHVLVRNHAGNDYVKLLYKNSEEIAAVLMENPILAAEAGELIDELLPGITALLGGDMMKLSEDESDRIVSLLSRFEIRASPQLKLVIRKAKKAMSKGKFFKELGRAINE
jgi:C1A family cysteine protease